MAEAAIIGRQPMDNFIREGFKGMRRHAIVVFARPFFRTEDNPNGTIDPFPEDMEKEPLDMMMDLYLQQGKFGSDPFNLQPQDEMAAMKKQIAELQAALAGPKANPENAGYKPPPADLILPNTTNDQYETATTHVAADGPVEDMPKFVSNAPYVPLEKMPWRDLVAKSKAMGLKPYQKTRTVLISEIEAREAE